MRNSTDETVSAVGEISETVTKLDEISASISVAMDEQSNSLQEISQNLDGAAEGAKLAGGSVGKVSKLAEETGEKASGVYEASTVLSKQTSTLKDTVDEFLSEIRTG